MNVPPCAAVGENPRTQLENRAASNRDEHVRPLPCETNGHGSREPVGTRNLIDSRRKGQERFSFAHEPKAPNNRSNDRARLLTCLRTQRTTSARCVRKPICPASSIIPNRASEISRASARWRSRGHDHVAGTRQHQSRCTDAPEPVRNVERFESRQTLGHLVWPVSQIRSTTKSTSGPGSGLLPKSRWKN